MTLLHNVADDQQALIRTAEQLAEERFLPRAAAYDEKKEFPWDDYKDLHAAGLLGLVVPTEFGGRNVSAVTYAQVLKAIARGNSSTALTFNMHSTVVRLLRSLATHNQQSAYFTDLVQNGALMATITSEPSSSLRGKFTLSTVAKPVDGGYLVSGTKHFCSLSEAATYYFVWACLEHTPIEHGLVNLMIRSDSPGITLERTWNSVAMRSTSSHTLHFKDVFVPAEHMVGQPGQLLQQGLTDSFILGYCAVYLGIAEGALNFTINYANQTRFKPDDKPISHFSGVQNHIAEMAMQIEASRLMLERAALAYDSGTPREKAKWLNQSKYASTEAAVKVTDLAIRTCGGRALLCHHPLERYLRDARAGVIMPPHNDKCMEVIGQAHLGLEVDGGFISK